MSAAPLLDVSGLACGYPGRVVVRDVSFGVEPGGILGLLGPNGVGKTTLFKTILRLLPPLAGEVRVQGRTASAWTRREFAARVGYVPQAHTPPFPFLVRDVVILGRVARLGAFGSPSAADYAVAEQSLDALGIAHLTNQPYTGLSGGERQLVLIARALCQEPAVLVMDEPTSNLDFGNQHMVLGHVRELARGRGLGVVLTTHEPQHALMYASRAATLGRDGGFAVGAPNEVITAGYLRTTYGVADEVLRCCGL